MKSATYENEKNDENSERDFRRFRYLNNKFWIVLILVAVLSSLLGSFFGLMASTNVSPGFQAKLNRILSRNDKSVTEIGVAENRKQIIFEDSAIIEVAKKSNPSVVSIMISKDVSTYQGNTNIVDPFWGIPLGDGSSGANQSDGQKTQKQVVGSASGFFITTDGLILTNKHVVEDKQSSFEVITQDGKQYSVDVLAQDPIRDVAIIKIQGNGFPILNLGDSDSLQIGQTVIAIGDSLGEFSNSVSRGIVSGLKRNVNAMSSFGETERLTDIIQTDAAINLGNSGGPLLNIDGDVVGINVARAQGAENIAFSLPINQVKRLIDQVKNGTKFSVAYLGVRYVVIDSLVESQAQLPVDYGVLVTRGSKVTDLAVLPGSAADLAGIAENDIILEINNQKITKDHQLGDIISSLNVGDTVNIKVWHKGQIKDVTATLQELK